MRQVQVRQVRAARRARRGSRWRRTSRCRSASTAPRAAPCIADLPALDGDCRPQGAGATAAGAAPPAVPAPPTPEFPPAKPLPCTPPVIPGVWPDLPLWAPYADLAEGTKRSAGCGADQHLPRTRDRHRLQRRRRRQHRRRRRDIARHRHPVERHRLAPGQRRAAHRGDRAGDTVVGVPRRRRVRPLGVVDRVGPVVHRPAAPRAVVPRRQVRVAPSQRHPAEHRRAGANRNDPARPAVPADQRGRPDRPRDVAAGYPAPAAADEGPATVVERRVAPRRVVDPGPAPARTATTSCRSDTAPSRRRPSSETRRRRRSRRCSRRRCRRGRPRRPSAATRTRRCGRRS